MTKFTLLQKHYCKSLKFIGDKIVSCQCTHKYTHMHISGLSVFLKLDLKLEEEFYLFYFLIEEGRSTLIIRLNSSNKLFSLLARITS